MYLRAGNETAEKTAFLEEPIRQRVVLPVCRQ